MFTRCCYIQVCTMSIEGSIQMWPHCRLKIAYCYGPRTWIFGRTPWTDVDQTSTIHTPVLTGHDAVAGVEMTWDAGHPRSSSLPLPSSSSSDVSGQSTDQTMWRCVTLLSVLDADWPSIRPFRQHPVTVLAIIITLWIWWELLSSERMRRVFMHDTVRTLGAAIR